MTISSSNNHLVQQIENLQKDFEIDGEDNSKVILTKVLCGEGQDVQVLQSRANEQLVTTLLNEVKGILGDQYDNRAEMAIKSLGRSSSIGMNRPMNDAFEISAKDVHDRLEVIIKGLERKQVQEATDNYLSEALPKKIDDFAKTLKPELTSDQILSMKSAISDKLSHTNTYSIRLGALKKHFDDIADQYLGQYREHIEALRRHGPKKPAYQNMIFNNLFQDDMTPPAVTKATLRALENVDPSKLRDLLTRTGLTDEDKAKEFKSWVEGLIQETEKHMGAKKLTQKNYTVFSQLTWLTLLDKDKQDKPNLLTTLQENQEQFREIYTRALELELYEKSNPPCQILKGLQEAALS